MLHGAGEDGALCMWEASRMGYVEVVQALLVEGGESHLDLVIEGQRASCLRNACCSGHSEVAKLLLARLGPGLLRQTPTEAADCLRLACDRGHSCIVDLLVGAMDVALWASLKGTRRACLTAARQRGQEELATALRRRPGGRQRTVGWLRTRDAIVEAMGRV